MALSGLYMETMVLALRDVVAYALHLVHGIVDSMVLHGVAVVSILLMPALSLDTRGLGTWDPGILGPGEGT
jgi:hypothetical protein